MGKAIYVGVSEWFTAESRRLMGGDWRTIYNGIEISGYTATASVGADAPLVFLSRIAPIKGCHLAIMAAKAAGCRLVIAGNIQDQAYFDRHIQPNLETGKIEYVGTVNDAQKNALLGRARALIVPVQWDEPFGLVFAESLACGTPVISWKRGALPEIIDHGRTGFLVTAEEALAPAIDRLHTLDRRACRESAERRFSAETLFRSYENLCLEALSRPSSMRRNP
jgi:glycosyltransferase involved in cell wall biosynthesis